MAYRVTAPMVNLKIKDPVTGAYTVQGFYEGAVVDDIEPDNLRHHLDGDMVEEVAAPTTAADEKDEHSGRGRPRRADSSE